CLMNRFDMAPPAGDRARTRAALGIEPHERLVLQPTRAIPRKNVPAGLRFAEQIGGTFWLTGAVEDDYQKVI
ncbi:MAG: hypothetical protein WCL21_19265, partial [Mariniphaga sp.]